jgi:hypothetical protein
MLLIFYKLYYLVNSSDFDPYKHVLLYVYVSYRCVAILSTKGFLARISSFPGTGRARELGSVSFGSLIQPLNSDEILF